MINLRFQEALFNLDVELSFQIIGNGVLSISFDLHNPQSK
jgi:hypothetical protein